MNIIDLVRRSFFHHGRSHIGTFIGVVIAAAVITGALLVGSSVRGSLQEMADNRLGKIRFALPGNDRLFRDSLGHEILSELGEDTTLSAPVLILPATAAKADGSARANEVQVLGVNEGFWKLARQESLIPEIKEDEVWINEPLARQLAVEKGDTVLMRVSKPSDLSPDAPMSPVEDLSRTLRLTVAGVVDPAGLGHFSLKAGQIPPMNAFVRLNTLQDRVDAVASANLLLLGSSEKDIEEVALQNALKAKANLEDYQLELLQQSEGDSLELRSSRVFLDQLLGDTLAPLNPDVQILTYFVNRIEGNERLTPYSMVSGLESPHIPADLQPGEILITPWLQEDLGVQPGDPLDVTYYTVGLSRELKEESVQFQVKSVLEADSPLIDPGLMPDFPGLTDADNCRDWDTGFPIDTNLIRDKDEDYWDEYRGTPKAFIGLGQGQDLWGNRFGNLTAIRWDIVEGTEIEDYEVELESNILEALDPTDFGLVWAPVGERAGRAANDSMDFGQLFVGFSFFLILSALVLMNMLFRLSLEQRAPEMGLLLALGFKPERVRKMLTAEGLGLALIGSLVGAVLGVVYADLMIRGLSSIWSEAVGSANLSLHISFPRLLAGMLIGFVCAAATLIPGLRKICALPARDLMAGTVREGIEVGGQGRTWTAWVPRASLGLALLCAIAGIFMDPGQRPGVFFGAGAFFLLASATFGNQLLKTMANNQWSKVEGGHAKSFNLTGLSVRNTSRRRTRSVATAVLLACGSFLVASIGVFRLDAVRNADERSSGTGGFSLWGESSLPVIHDLNSAEAREFYVLDEDLFKDFSVVPMRLLEGDEASCLNLNRAQQPEILGVNPDALAQRNAFTFAKVSNDLPDPQGSPWNLLDVELEGDLVPGIADMNSILWAMGKKVGDTLTYVNKNGKEFRVKLVAGVANSILQGKVIISEEQFVRQFSSKGYQAFLIDTPPAERDRIKAELSRSLQDEGLALTDSTVRLAAFNAVQNTYLSTFQVLGALGLFLGSAGMAVIVLRNVLERKKEFSLLIALGFRPGKLKWILFSEHGALFVTGMVCGILSAALAVLPSLMDPTRSVPVLSLTLTQLAVLASGLAWTWIASTWALRGSLIEGLRSE